MSERNDGRWRNVSPIFLFKETHPSSWEEGSQQRATSCRQLWGLPEPQELPHQELCPSWGSPYQWMRWDSLMGRVCSRALCWGDKGEPEWSSSSSSDISFLLFSFIGVQTLKKILHPKLHLSVFFRQLQPAADNQGDMSSQIHRCDLEMRTPKWSRYEWWVKICEWLLLCRRKNGEGKEPGTESWQTPTFKCESGKNKLKNCFGGVNSIKCCWEAR